MSSPSTNDLIEIDSLIVILFLPLLFMNSITELIDMPREKARRVSFFQQWRNNDFQTRRNRKN